MGLTSVIKVLLIEDNIAEARLLREVLKGATRQEFDLCHEKRLENALNALESQAFDVILLDLTLPDSQGLDSLLPIISKNSYLPIVVLTNMNDEELMFFTRRCVLLLLLLVLLLLYYFFVPLFFSYYYYIFIIIIIIIF